MPPSRYFTIILRPAGCANWIYPKISKITHRGRAGQGGPAAAWYFAYILYYILDIFGYVQFGHPSARRSETLIGHCYIVKVPKTWQTKIPTMVKPY